jgi:exodeoxyribonuclease-3
MQIISLNLNGVRAAAKKGFFEWLAAQSADVVCVQELKAQVADLSADMLALDSYRGYFHCAAQRGYSGVGIYCRKQPDNVIEGIGITEIDDEGRFIQADFGNLSIISIYLPSGSSGEHRQVAKFFFMEKFYPVLKTLMASGREIICAATGILPIRKST